MTAALVREHLKAMERATLRAVRSKKTARAFLVKAGIAAKGGKTLAKAYR